MHRAFGRSTGGPASRAAARHYFAAVWRLDSIWRTAPTSQVSAPEPDLGAFKGSFLQIRGPSFLLMTVFEILVNIDNSEILMKTV